MVRTLRLGAVAVGACGRAFAISLLGGAAVLFAAGEVRGGDDAGATAEPQRDGPVVQQIPGTDVTFEMVPIPGGRFRIGSPAAEPGRNADEGPQVEVEVAAFYMGRFEVTWPEYEAFAGNYRRLADARVRTKVPPAKLLEAVTYPTPMYELEMDNALRRMGGRGAGFPAVTVSHFAARQYCKWLSHKTGRFYRLPTEAEWEYACRAGTTTAYSFGDDPKGLDGHGVYFGNCELPTGEWGYRKVGGRKPNAWGLHDMHGNVAEWCIDQYDPEWYERFAGKGPVKSSELINWPTKRYPCVLRGGHFESEASECRSASRLGSEKMMNIYDASDMNEGPHWETAALWAGFRIVAPVDEPPEAEKQRFSNPVDAATLKALQRSREIHELFGPAGK